MLRFDNAVLNEHYYYIIITNANITNTATGCQYQSDTHVTQLNDFIQQASLKVIVVETDVSGSPVD